MFKSAAKFQEKKESQSSVSVVVLDEVGLAEDSPALPLKALHPLLEDGTAGTGDVCYLSIICINATDILQDMYIGN